MKNKMLQGVSFWILLIFIILLMAIFAFTKSASKTNLAKLQDLASKLDYKPETQIVQYQTRWNIFPTSHGEMLYYSTRASLEQFQELIDNITISQELPAFSDGYDLFSVNYSTNHFLTINGMGNSSDRTTTREPDAYRWRIFYKNRNWSITYYQITNDGQIYRFDNEPIMENIVTILLQTN